MANCKSCPSPDSSTPIIFFLAKVLVFNLLVSVRLLSPMPPYNHTGLLWGSARGMKRAKLMLFLVGNS